MRNTLLITTLLIAGMSSATLASAKVLTGKWNGKSPTTLEFLGGSKVKYCYKAKCTTRTYTGDQDKTIKFNWGRSQFTFTKTDSGYDGNFLRVMSSKVKLQ